MSKLLTAITGCILIMSLYAVFLLLAGFLFGLLAVVGTWTYHLLGG
jgi:hypothetical protein